MFSIKYKFYKHFYKCEGSPHPHNSSIPCFLPVKDTIPQGPKIIITELTRLFPCYAIVTTEQESATLKVKFSHLNLNGSTFNIQCFLVKWSHPLLVIKPHCSLTAGIHVLPTHSLLSVCFLKGASEEDWCGFWCTAVRLSCSCSFGSFSWWGPPSKWHLQPLAAMLHSYICLNTEKANSGGLTV